MAREIPEWILATNRQWQQDQELLRSVGPLFDFGEEAFVWGDENWGVTTHRVIVPNGEIHLWHYNANAFHYTSAKVIQEVAAGKVPSIWERLQGCKEIPPRHGRNLEFRSYNPCICLIDSDGQEYASHGWQSTSHADAPEIEVFATRVTEQVERHRAAHREYMAKLRVNADDKVRRAEASHLATIRNLPRLPEGS